MAGLLEGGYWGDDTTKDQFGQTQADRREPVWAGLIQGGMGLLAGSQAMMPAERARYIAQAGQAYGGIPAAIRAGQSAAAQQTLQAQQIKAGQAKLDTAGRLAAMAKTPEFQAAVAKLEPEERMLLQASLDAGDMNNAQQILSGASKARIAQAEVLRKEKRDDAKEAATRAAAEAKEAGFGNTPYGINARNLRDAPIDSYAYWLAHQFFGTDQKQPDGSIIPKLPNHEKLEAPEWKPGMPPQGTPGKRTATPIVDPNAPKPAEPDPNAPKPPEVDPNAPKPPDPNTPLKPDEVRRDEVAGTEEWRLGDRTYKAFADDRVEIRDSKGNLIGTELPKEIPPAEQAKMNEAKALRAGINDSAQKFLARWRAASPLERGAALLNKSHPLNQAWVNTMLQAKGPALYDLGVLNQGDLPQLQKALSDPNIPMSQIFSKTEDVESQVADMLSVMDARRISKENSYKEQRRRRPPKAAAASAEPEYVEDPANPGNYIKKK